MSTVPGNTRSKLAAFVGVSILCLTCGAALVAVRFALTDTFFYYFLIWNLVLALAPYGIAVGLSAVVLRPRTRLNIAAIAALGTCWLLFYPNAPYIFTDFIHVVNRTYVRGGGAVGKETLVWFDLVLCSAFAFMGHYVGLVSIDLVLDSFKGVLRPLAARALVGVAIALAGFGIYVGRFVRFNSWDIILAPLATASKLLPYLKDPRAVLLSAAFAAFILITFAVHHLSRKA